MAIRDRFSFKGRQVQRIPVNPYHESRGTTPVEPEGPSYSSPSAWYTSRANEYRTVSVYGSGEPDGTAADRPSTSEWGVDDNFDSAAPVTVDFTSSSNRPRPRSHTLEYRPDSEELIVQFRGKMGSNGYSPPGPRYRYDNVTPEMWEELDQIQKDGDPASTGKWLDRNLGTQNPGSGTRLS